MYNAESDVCVSTWTSLREDLHLSWTAHLLSCSDRDSFTGTCRSHGVTLAKEVLTLFFSVLILLVYRLFRFKLNLVESQAMEERFRFLPSLDFIILQDWKF